MYSSVCRDCNPLERAATLEGGGGGVGRTLAGR